MSGREEPVGDAPLVEDVDVREVMPAGPREHDRMIARQTSLAAHATAAYLPLRYG